MSTSHTSLTGAAGEHFVAYRLSSMGHAVALTRGGSPTVDLMVCDDAGCSAVSIQVKTSRWAWRSRKRDPAKSHWEWDVGPRVLLVPPSQSRFYAFVDLCCEADGVTTRPTVFLVPSQDVHAFVQSEWSRKMFWIFAEDKDKYCEAWHRITDRLSPHK